MSKYSNVTKGNESTIGGVKYRAYFTSATLLQTCPSPKAVKAADDDYKFLEGDFVFKNVLDKFNVIEFVSTTGELKWESIGSVGNLKFKNMFAAFFATMKSSFYRFVEEGRNDELVMVIERADCSGDMFVFGGCCLPAQMTKLAGGLGDKPEADIGTKIDFEAFSNGLPMMLPAGTIIDHV